MQNLIITFGILILTTMSSAFAFEPETTEPIQQSIIEVQSPYAFATMPGATTGAAFMVLKNTGELDDKLISAQSAVADITEIHQNMIDPDDGTMMMRKVKEIAIPMGEQTTLEPKGYHVMFIKMKKALIMGETVDITLVFEKAGEIKTSASVIAPGLKPKVEKKMPWDEAEVETTTNVEKTETPEPQEERIDY